ncbi:MAG TPA: aldose epimerase family protein [Spirochaetales bacterium]|nr:aldose epimerase family protein [Spirochaetales bacterium]
MSIRKTSFGTTAEGFEASLYTLSSGGLEAGLSDFGATLVFLEAPAGRGETVDLVLGLESAAAYEASDAYLGATAGRFANRIAKGRFSLDGKDYGLAANNGPNHLHGGLRGFDKRPWRVEASELGGSPALRFSRLSPDGEEGYPGALSVSATYVLEPEGVLRVLFEAGTDAATLVSLTQHAYFNLRGAGSGDILGHDLELRASRYLPIDKDLIPTGELAPVEGGPFDFRAAKPLGRDIEALGDAAGGYDHCFVLDRDGDGLFEFAELREPLSGRRMTAATTLPGVQLYTGNFLSGAKGRKGQVYARRGGVCLEAELFPDSPNRPAFPSPVLRPGETWRHETLYRFFL